MKACEVTIGISISFCSVRVERFIRRNYELIMAPDLGCNPAKNLNFLQMAIKPLYGILRINHKARIPHVDPYF